MEDSTALFQNKVYHREIRASAACRDRIHARHQGARHDSSAGKLTNDVIAARLAQGPALSNLREMMGADRIGTDRRGQEKPSHSELLQIGAHSASVSGPLICSESALRIWVPWLAAQPGRALLSFRNTYDDNGGGEEFISLCHVSCREGLLSRASGDSWPMLCLSRGFFLSLFLEESFGTRT